jgi:SF3a60/Prp9 C-terminal
VQADSESDEEEKTYNPLNLPMGWDGKPIPYWLYKLHGLGQVLFLCLLDCWCMIRQHAVFNFLFFFLFPVLLCFFLPLLGGNMVFFLYDDYGL